jgi:hypothetical protein
MIDRALLRRLLAVAAAVLAAAAAVSGVLWKTWAVPGGLALGFALGAAPFLSWGWVLSRGLRSAKARALAVALLAGKLLLYAGSLYLFVTRNLVHPAAVLAGITLVVAVFSVGSIRASAVRPREAA